MSDNPQPLGLEPTFGFGDRLGLATPGHIAALAAHSGRVLPLFAQQSIREMTRTARSAGEVMQAAKDAIDATGFEGVWGADGDHLKTPADVDTVAAAGFVFFTIDPSDHVDEQADDYSVEALAAKFAEVRASIPWLGDYQGKQINVPEGPTISFDEETVQRAAVKYGRAIAHTIEMGRYIDQVMGGSGYEIELSVDETPQPTTLAEHYIFAEQCCRSGMKLVSLAPRYIGDFEKGIDYKGDIAALEASLADHAAIARALGPYKLSLHSGSDKLSIYASFARITGGMFHVKTAGTSYLEAIRVVAREDEDLFRRIVDFSRDHFDADKATYHISATLAAVAAPADMDDVAALERLYLDEDDGRQILHVTFGSVLTDEVFGPAVREVLTAHPETHAEVLAKHLGLHLAELNKGLGEA